MTGRDLKAKKAQASREARRRRKRFPGASKARRRRAFTLIELLVVIAIHCPTDHGDAQYPDVKSCWDSYGIKQ
jgi:Prokaryotic N-terminal methylation motif